MYQLISPQFSCSWLCFVFLLLLAWSSSLVGKLGLQNKAFFILRKQKPENIYKSGGLTLYSVLSMPIRKINSAMRRLMQRFLWIVFRSLWRPRKKQKVKMQIARQTREMTIPTQVMTVRSKPCIPFLYWKWWKWRKISVITD